MKQDTKQKILEIGGELIHRQGYNNTGISEILKAAGVPKGSFYFYFKSKEDFGVQVINYFRSVYAHAAGEILADESLPHLVRLRKVFDWFLKYFETHGFQRGCPVGNIAQEMSDLSPAFRDELDQAISQMVEITAGVLKKAQQAGELDMKRDPNELARFITCSWEGSLILMKVERRAEPMLTFDRMVFENLLA